MVRNYVSGRPSVLCSRNGQDANFHSRSYWQDTRGDRQDILSITEALGGV